MSGSNAWRQHLLRELVCSSCHNRITSEPIFADKRSETRIICFNCSKLLRLINADVYYEIDAGEKLRTHLEIKNSYENLTCQVLSSQQDLTSLSIVTRVSSNKKKLCLLDEDLYRKLNNKGIDVVALQISQVVSLSNCDVTCDLGISNDNNAGEVPENIYQEVLDPLKKCPNECSWVGVDHKDHLRTCKMKAVNCPAGQCTFSAAEAILAKHLELQHKDSVVASEQFEARITRMDLVRVLLCFGKIFIFKYYVYDRYVEFLVEVVAHSDDINHPYYFEVEFVGEPKLPNKSKKCLLFNKSTLENGIVVDASEFVKFGRYIFKATIKQQNLLANF